MPDKFDLSTMCICLVLAFPGGYSATTAEAAEGSARAVQSQASPAAVPFSVVSTQVDPSSATVTFTLQNTGSKPITAWDVAIVVGVEPEARYGGYGVDAFRQFERLAEGHSYLEAGGTAVATAKLPSGSDALGRVVVTANAAVFADRSYAGDEKFAEMIFERRAAQLQAWQDIVRQLESTRNAGSIDAAKLETVLSAVNGSIASAGPDIVRTTFRANLSVAIANVRSGHAQAAPTLTRFLDEAYRNVAIATVHSRR